MIEVRQFAALAPAEPRRVDTHGGWVGRWPSALGLAVAVLLLWTGAAGRETLAIGVTAAAMCYLAAGALGRRWVAWASVPGVSLVVVASEVAGLPWWAGVGTAGFALAALGLRRGVPRPTLTQGAAVLGFGAVAVLALAIAPRAGLVLAGLALASHAVWDTIHYHRNEVVPRSLAKACTFLDVPLGLGCIILAQPF